MGKLIEFNGWYGLGYQLWGIGGILEDFAD
jgi:hypothetical protein